MDFKNIIVNKTHNIAKIILNRPRSFNAFNADLGNDFVKALELCSEDRELRAIVITGNGKAFCAGGDIEGFKKAPDLSDDLRQGLKILNTIIINIRKIPIPVIAAINGPAGGAGISIAAACDFRIAAASAKFKQGFTSIGFAPAGGWTLLVPTLIGLSKAAELILLDPPLDANEALKIGLVNKVAEDSQFENATNEIVERIANGTTTSFAIVKENFNLSLLANLEKQLELERFGVIKATKTSDAKEGISAFLEKRKPVFVGH